MSTRFASHQAIIDAWPTLSVFAADVGITYGNAKAMRRRDRIGLEHVAAVVAAATTRSIEGVTADLIAELAAEKAAALKASNSTATAGSQP